jgi:hypothetical protein
MANGNKLRLGDWITRSSADVLADTSMADVVWKMFVKAYSSLGIKHQGPEQFFGEYPCVLLCYSDSNDRIRAVIMYDSTLPHANKLSAVFSDGTALGKNVLLSKLAHLLVSPGWVIEQSGAPAHIMSTYYNLKPMTDLKTVSRVINKDVQPSSDTAHAGAGYYERKLKSGEVIHKSLYGVPCPVDARKAGEWSWHDDGSCSRVCLPSDQKL